MLWALLLQFWGVMAVCCGLSCLDYSGFSHHNLSSLQIALVSYPTLGMVWVSDVLVVYVTLQQAFPPYSGYKLLYSSLV